MLSRGWNRPSTVKFTNDDYDDNGDGDLMRKA
jgi:hypothetical protein